MTFYKRLLLGILFLPLINANIVIDVRTPDEWSAGHLEGTKNIEWQDILNIKNSVNKDEQIYLYCRSGNRSGRATQILMDAGYSNVINAGSLEQASNLLNLKIVK
ncbi:rhodanese-like domain-containing protein [Gammaproteobacteria bacterium]|nr:rhodanese-like domain-containing protein [Gammaproteobacteria bacterium]MDB3915443.1 rhodanese-like domain-containing protein [Gammaproteobacteria bacterium]